MIHADLFPFPPSPDLPEPINRLLMPERSLNPAAALNALLEGNHRFVTGCPCGLNRDVDGVSSLRGTQNPFAAILGCADSRVPLEILFDQGFGDLFAVRVAGNVASTAEIGSLEYSAAVLHTPLLMVLGHTSCGAVQAAREGAAVPGQIPALLEHINRALRPGESDARRAVEANAVHQAQVLRSESPLIDELVEAGKLGLVAAVFDLANGEVHLLETYGLEP